MAEHMTAVTAEQLRAELADVIDDLRTTPGDMRRAEYAVFSRSIGRLESIAARLSGMAAGWQPIETAPKDGKDYIASDGRLRTLENQPQGCMPGRWSKGPDGKWSGYANRPIGYAPKYWHPLPAAPEPPHV